MKNINRTTLFLILTFVISFLLAGIFSLAGVDANNSIGFTILGVIYMFVPTIAVVIVRKFVHRENITGGLMVSFRLNKWFLVAWLFMPVLIFSTVGISLLFPGMKYSPEMEGMFERFSSMMSPEQIEEMRNSLATLPVSPVWMTLAQGLIAGITVNAIAAFGEEFGWRGFLLRELRRMSFVKASLAIGVIWGIWHAPMILMGHNYPQHPQIGVLMMVVLCVLLTPFLIYITIKAKSVIAAAIMHGTMNAVAGISLMVIEGGNDLTMGIQGLTGFLTITVFLTGLFIYDQYISKDKILTSVINTGLSNLVT